MTKEQILKSKMYSPGLIGGEITYFLAASKGFFFMKHNEDEGYIKAWIIFHANLNYIKM